MDATAGKKCLLDNKYLIPNINNAHKKFVGAAKTLFKERYSNHMHGFKHKKYMKCTELWKCIWNLKNQGITPIIKWRIVKKINCKVSSHYCKSCLTGNFFIIKSLDNCNLLNKKSELVSKCRHQNKLLLCNVKINDSMD